MHASALMHHHALAPPFNPRSLHPQVGEDGSGAAEGEGDKAAGGVKAEDGGKEKGELLLQELDDLNAVLAELRDKEGELVELCKANASMRTALK